MDAVRQSDLLDPRDIFEPEIADKEDIYRVHTPEYVESIKTFCKNGGGHLDFDTIASPQTYQIAKLSAGGAIKASKLVLDGYESAYSIGRPPGHHSTRNKAMGFCIFNNIAITLEYLREVKKIKKFLIFDFDIHYGNGTAEIFYEDPQVLYISIHQDPRTIFPGKGLINEIGNGEGTGYNLNMPMPPRSDSNDYMYLIDRILRPAAEQFAPDFYLVSVGFDGHEDDPLSSVNLDDQFYEWIAYEMMDIAGSLTLILEGGYNLPALYRCNLKLLNGLKEHKTLQDKFKQDTDKLDKSIKIHEQTTDIFNEIKESFSPYFEF